MGRVGRGWCLLGVVGLFSLRHILPISTFSRDFVAILPLCYRGAYGVVKKCVHKENGNIFAAKIIKTSNSNIRKSVMQEIEMMRAVGRHSKIVELFDAYQTPFEIVMVLEL